MTCDVTKNVIFGRSSEATSSEAFGWGYCIVTWRDVRTYVIWINAVDFCGGELPT